jgi:hypothetical protein
VAIVAIGYVFADGCSLPGQIPAMRHRFDKTDAAAALGVDVLHTVVAVIATLVP